MEFEKNALAEMFNTGNPEHLDWQYERERCNNTAPTVQKELHDDSAQERERDGGSYPEDNST